MMQLLKLLQSLGRLVRRSLYLIILAACCGGGGGGGSVEGILFSKPSLSALLNDMVLALLPAGRNFL